MVLVGIMGASGLSLPLSINKPDLPLSAGAV